MPTCCRPASPSLPRPSLATLHPGRTLKSAAASPCCRMRWPRWVLPPLLGSGCDRGFMRLPAAAAANAERQAAAWPANSWDAAPTRRQMLPTRVSPPQDAASWSALSRIQLCWSLPFLYATHVCSYSCALSQYAPAEASSMTLCWLSRQPAGVPGSTCPGWPTNYPGL